MRRAGSSYWLLVHPADSGWRRCVCNRRSTTSRDNYTVSPKTSPTFSTVTWKPITKFWWFLLQLLPKQLAIKWPFSFPPHTMYVSALRRESRLSEICVKINRKPEKHPWHYQSQLKERLADFSNFWQKYFWCNWLLNTCFSFHLTQRLLLYLSLIHISEPTRPY